MAFGDNLKAVRELRGKTAAQVYEGTKNSKGKYYAWEKNSYEPGPEIVDRLAEFLKVPREIFYKEKVTVDDLNSKQRTFRDEIFEGDYIGLHKKVWATVEHGIYHERAEAERKSAQVDKLTTLLAQAIHKLGPPGS